MKVIVEVAVPRPIWETFDYVYTGTRDRVKLGARVRVPFGRGSVIGIVLRYKRKSDFNLRSITAVLDSEPLVAPDQLQLAEWLADYYHHPIGSVLETMLPVQARRGKYPNLDGSTYWKVAKPALEKSFKGAPKQKSLYLRIADRNRLSTAQIRRHKYDKRVVDALHQKGFISRFQVRDPDPNYRDTIELSEQQEHCIKTITGDMGRFATYLLDGVTGSGKTEVYLRVIEQVLARGQQALVLVPEISLTPQTERRFKERFGGVASLHSMLAGGARFNAWARTANGGCRVLIGTRSTVFSPFSNLGVVIVDEEHDTSFKQIEGLRYSARDVAIYRARQWNIPCILGSATPSLESLANSERGKHRRLILTHRPGTAEMPTLHIQDLRKQSQQGGICQPLIEVIERHLNKNGQVLVLINRRGFAPSLFCTQCNWRANCEDCDAKLTWHRLPSTYLQCHKCLRIYPKYPRCPECGSTSLQLSGSGTQQVEETLQNLFQGVPIYRVDRDAMRTNRQVVQLFQELSKAGTGILIGTQMLAKGHHFPNVTLVAVIGADGGFLSTDFRGPERTAQLILQVAGRAGRADRKGEVWIQTFDPQNLDLQTLIRTGYRGFSKNELDIRKSAGLPPYAHMALIRVDAQTIDHGVEFINSLMDSVAHTGVQILGPVKAPIARISKFHRFQGAVISSRREQLHRALRMVEREKVPHRNMRWSIDVDPIDLY